MKLLTLERTDKRSPGMQTLGFPGTVEQTGVRRAGSVLAPPQFWFCYGSVGSVGSHDGLSPPLLL